MEQMVVRTVDLETTGFPPDADAVELGYIDTLLMRDEGAPHWEVADTAMRALQKFFKPDREMTIEARATHHIPDSDLRNATHHSQLADFALSDDVKIYVAHNAAFEQFFIKIPENAWWIDTYKVALRLYPEAPKHNNQFLRYFLELDLHDSFAMPPHRALPDAYVTAHIFAHWVSINACTLKEMAAWTLEPPYLTKLTFGKHVGMRYADAPKDYLRWIIRQSDMDEAVVAAAKRELGLP